MDEKKCIACERVLPASAFYVHKQRSPGESPLSSRCKECAKIWAAERYEAVGRYDEERKAKQREISREYYRNNRDKILSQIKERRQETCETRHKRYQKLRALCLELYGGQCECCGEKRLEFLAFDHVNGGGGKHRDSIGNHFIAWLVRYSERQPGIRILCHNCNSALGFYGYCPHEREREPHE